jgi:lactoylglutathione lyase
MPPQFIHCMMHVADLGRSIAFYEAALGFKVVDRHRYEGHRLVYLRNQAGGMEIELVQPDAGAVGTVAAGRLWHLGFRVEDVRKEYARLQALGCRLDPLDAYHANGSFMCDYFYVYDPDGHQIEILQGFGRYAEAASANKESR